MNNLAQHVQALPQEINDMIFDFTLTGSLSKEYRIDRDYRPPSFLQLNHAIRRKFARMYYSDGSTFTVNRYIANFWLGSLSATHRRMLFSAKIHKDEAALKFIRFEREVV